MYTARRNAARGLVSDLTAAAFVGLAVFLLGCAICAVTGCAAGMSPAVMEQNLQAVSAANRDAAAKVDAARAAAATQPADSPGHAQAVAVLDKATAALEQSQRALDLATAAAAVAAGKPPNTAPLSALGPYGELAGIVIVGAWGAVNQIKKNNANAAALVSGNALKQTVQGLDVAGGPTAEQKAALSQTQDAATRALVAAHRLPDPTLITDPPAAVAGGAVELEPPAARGG
jgi:hypothetical protein